MGTKKLIGLIVSLVFLAAIAGVIAWAVINFEKVKAGMSGTELYTQDDLNKSYEDGYNTALKNESEYQGLIDTYSDTIISLNDTIAQLNARIADLNTNAYGLELLVSTLQTQKTNLETAVTNLTNSNAANADLISNLNAQVLNLNAQINGLSQSGENKDGEISSLTAQITSLNNIISGLQTANGVNLATIAALTEQVNSLNDNLGGVLSQTQNYQNTISALNAQVQALQNSVSYYQQLLAALQTDDKAVATFMYNEAVYNVQVVDKGSYVNVQTPLSTAYLIFNGWSVNGTTAVNLSTYRVTENTTFTALLTYKYDVTFMYESTQYNAQIVEKNQTASVTNPMNTTYKEFKGWSLDGNTIITLSAYPIAQNTTFYAVINNKTDVAFTVDGEVYRSQIVSIGGYATAPTPPSKTGSTFNGWTVDGANVINLANFPVLSSTSFIAKFTVNTYTVTFTVDGITVSTQTVSYGSYATTPAQPQKPNNTFNGWTVDGNNVINVAAYPITSGVTFIAKFTVSAYSVTFIVDGVTADTQTVIAGAYAASPAAPIKTNYVFNGWSINGTTTVTLANTPINSNTVFTALWTYYEVVYSGVLEYSGAEARIPKYNIGAATASRNIEVDIVVSERNANYLTSKTVILTYRRINGVWSFVKKTYLNITDADIARYNGANTYGANHDYLNIENSITVYNSASAGYICVKEAVDSDGDEIWSEYFFDVPAVVKVVLI